MTLILSNIAYGVFRGFRVALCDMNSAMMLAGDLATLGAHPAVTDCNVIGVSSEAWGETPTGFYVPHTAVAGSVAEVLERALRDRLEAGA